LDICVKELLTNHLLQRQLLGCKLLCSMLGTSGSKATHTKPWCAVCWVPQGLTAHTPSYTGAGGVRLGILHKACLALGLPTLNAENYTRDATSNCHALLECLTFHQALLGTESHVPEHTFHADYCRKACQCWVHLPISSGNLEPRNLSIA